MHDVFISYSHKDKTVADAICARFESDNIRCWYAPRDIAPGADWAASIIDAIKASKVMVLIFTDFSNASDQVLREVSNAVDSNVPIVPFKMTETLPTKGMQYYLATVHWLDAMTLSLEKSIDSLDELVSAILNGTAPSSTDKRFQDAKPKGAKKSYIVPILLSVAVILIAAGVSVFLVLQGTKGGGDTAETTGVVLPVEESEELEILEPPGDSELELDFSNTGTDGNLQCNYQNQGLVATDGEWFFFQGNHRQSMYRMRIDGTEKSKLNDIPSSFIGVIDGYIYYYGNSASLTGIMRMKIDGTENTVLYSSSIEHMLIYDGRIYFDNPRDHLTLYSMDLEGNDVKKENDIREKYASKVLWEDRMYWINKEDNSTIYSVNIDGTDPQKLTERSADSLTVVDGWLVYSDTTIRMMNLKTKEVIDSRSTKANELLACEYGIFATSQKHSQQLYRLPVGSDSGSVAFEVKMNHICEAAGYIFYIDADDFSMYLVDYKGEKSIKL